MVLVVALSAAAPIVIGWIKRSHFGLVLPFLRLQVELTLFESRRKTIVSVFDRQVRASPLSTFIVHGGRRWSYLDIYNDSLRIAAFAQRQRIRPGAVVALLSENSARFVSAWLGLARVSITTALVSPQLRGTSLLHAINVSTAATLIASRAALGAYLAACEGAPGGATREDALDVWVFGASVGSARGQAHTEVARAVGDLDAALAVEADLSKVAALEGDAAVPLFYVFTSGTTGVPKACRISHAREAGGAMLYGILNRVRRSDRIYSALALHHSAGCLPVGMSMYTGASIVLPAKFSASGCMRECAEASATILFYIGEMTRYLVCTPPGTHDRAHVLRLAIGNGMQPEVWDRFQNRFGVRTVCEYYSSTEGTITMLNVLGRPHAVGCLPWWIQYFYRVPIIRVGQDGAPIRTDSGLCVECRPAEQGEALGPIGGSSAADTFEGYTDASQTSSKIVSNVLRQGDRWFRSGDLMRRDGEGFYFFEARAAQNFRWKAETIAPLQLEAAISSCSEITVADVCASGVCVPAHDGRAPLASIVLGGGASGNAAYHPATGAHGEAAASSRLDIGSVRRALALLHSHLVRELPSFALPVFIRVTGRIQTNDSFKHVQQASDLEALVSDAKSAGDMLYVYDAALGVYSPLDVERLLASARDGTLRL